jgi:hypothetical protein
MEQQVTLKPNRNLTGLVQDLSTNLNNLQPNQSETTQLITYALLAIAVVGIAVYHYIKHQERSPDCFSLEKELEAND